MVGTSWHAVLLSASTCGSGLVTRPRYPTKSRLAYPLSCLAHLGESLAFTSPSTPAITPAISMLIMPSSLTSLSVYVFFRPPFLQRLIYSTPRVRGQEPMGQLRDCPGLALIVRLKPLTNFRTSSDTFPIDVRNNPAIFQNALSSSTLWVDIYCMRIVRGALSLSQRHT